MMTESDLMEVLEVERSVFSSPWTLGNFRDELRSAGACGLVARREGEVVAYVTGWIVAGELKINNIAVRPDRQGRGLGAMMLERMLERARVAGCREATLEVRPSNRPALGLYRRYGFRTVGRRRAYYRDSGEDALLMTANLEGRCRGARSDDPGGTATP